jgi:hypothetical protein
MENTIDLGYLRYKELVYKLNTKQITKKEYKELEILAFRKKFANDKNPNKKWKE